MPKLKSERHHWWPRCVSAHWAAEDGTTGWFMSSSLHHIEEQARSLSAEDRAKLAEFMLESLHTSIEEIEAASSEEIALRIDAFENGDISAYSAEQVFAETRKILQ
jgi:putative addiction module component (TIGR02574 family)